MKRGMGRVYRRKSRLTKEPLATYIRAERDTIRHHRWSTNTRRSSSPVRCRIATDGDGVRTGFGQP